MRCHADFYVPKHVIADAIRISGGVGRDELWMEGNEEASDYQQQHRQAA